jgi:preprotein translocase subunit SecG
MNVNVLLWLVGIVYVLACLWLILVVLLQEGKTGGMGGAEAGGQAPGALTETFGAGGAQRGLFKVTSWTAGIFFLLAIFLTILGNKKEEMGGSLNLEEGVEAVAPGTTSAEPIQLEQPESTPPAEANQ